MGRPLTDAERKKFSEERARNLEELAALREDMERRKRVTILDLHRRPEPEETKTMSTLTDHQIAAMVAALREETRRQLDEYRGFMSELLTQLIASVQADIKKAIRKVRAEVDAARTDAAEAKAIATSGNVELITKHNKERA